jgi:hypothetical protein
MLNFGKSVPIEVQELLDTLINVANFADCPVKVRFKSQQWLQRETGHYDCFLSGCADFKNGKGYISLAESMQTWQIVHCFVHEMQHIQQFLDGRLESKAEGFYWLGELWEGDYNSQPWEVEAEQAANDALERMITEWSGMQWDGMK